MYSNMKEHGQSLELKEKWGCRRLGLRVAVGNLICSMPGKALEWLEDSKIRMGNEGQWKVKAKMIGCGHYSLGQPLGPVVRTTVLALASSPGGFLTWATLQDTEPKGNMQLTEQGLYPDSTWVGLGGIRGSASSKTLTGFFPNKKGLECQSEKK